MLLQRGMAELLATANDATAESWPRCAFALVFARRLTVPTLSAHKSVHGSPDQPATSTASCKLAQFGLPLCCRVHALNCMRAASQGSNLAMAVL